MTETIARPAVSSGYTPAEIALENFAGQLQEAYARGARDAIARQATAEIIAYAFDELAAIHGPNLTEEIRRGIDGTEGFLTDRLVRGMP